MSDKTPDEAVIGHINSDGATYRGRLLASAITLDPGTVKRIGIGQQVDTADYLEQLKEEEAA